MSESKLGFLIATAFSNTTDENWNVCRTLEDGMNWAVRFMNGAREICCWRTLETWTSDKEAETMARHAGFMTWSLEEKTNPAKLVAVIVREMPAVTPENLEMVEFENLDIETPKRLDHRPGKPLESPRRMKPNQVYHFEAFDVLWVAKSDQTQTVISIGWAAQEPLEGSDGGYRSGTLAQFEAWFKLHGQLSPLEPPFRWRA